MNISVEAYILESGRWQESLNMLREIMLALNLEETVKWGIPVYCINGKNVVGIASFKSYTGLWFYQGIFLKDKFNKLYNAQERSENSMRQWRFESADEIEDELDVLVEYIEEAIENSKQGKETKPQKNKPYTIPEELQDALNNDQNLRLNFETLSRSNKKDFSLYIGQAKKHETRKRRVEKCIPLIRENKGLMEQYKKKK